MPNRFKDHFSAVAGNYAAFRPTYPPALFAWLASVVPAHQLAWDCATGSGQAAEGLAAYFDKVLASDASAAQIGAAVPHRGIDYRVAPAEHSGLAARSVDLLTVAQALHWFDLPAFYREARRVLKPGGVLAVWTYGVQHVEGHADGGEAVDGKAADALLQHFYRDTVGPFWPPERTHVESAYRTLDFPFAELAAPPLAMTADWTLAQLLGYVGSWSATARFIAHHGRDPLPALAAALAAVWGQPQQTRRIRWPLAVRAARL